MKKINMATVLVTILFFSMSAFAGGACVHHVVLIDFYGNWYAD